MKLILLRQHLISLGQQWYQLLSAITCYNYYTFLLNKDYLSSNNLNYNYNILYLILGKLYCYTWKKNNNIKIQTRINYETSIPQFCYYGLVKEQLLINYLETQGISNPIDSMNKWLINNTSYKNEAF